jgi:hypothetical protein
MQDTGTLQRHCGTTTVRLSDAARIGRARRWDDLLSYTPQYPDGEAPGDDDRYTRGTIGLFLSQVIPDSPLAQQARDRLRPALDRFLPINVRAVVVLAPRVDIEFVYGGDDGRDIQEEKVFDDHPFIEAFGDIAESVTASVPDWSLLLSNTLGHVSADPANLNTLRRRTYFDPVA